MNLKNLKKGNLLVANPSLIGDFPFSKSLILLANHDEKGSIGFIMNKPLNYNIKDLVPNINANFKVYNGGPVEQDTLYFIHNSPDLIPNSVEISNGIYWGGTFGVITDLINKGVLKLNDIRFFLGYTGWEQNQLLNEISENSWFITHYNYKKNREEGFIIKPWEEQIKIVSEEFQIWVNAPENPELN